MQYILASGSSAKASNRESASDIGRHGDLVISLVFAPEVSDVAETLEVSKEYAWIGHRRAAIFELGVDQSSNNTSVIDVYSDLFRFTMLLSMYEYGNPPLLTLRL